MAKQDKPRPFDFAISEDKAKVTITPLESTYELTAGGIEQVAYWFGSVRQHMTPPVAPDPLGAQMLPAVMQYQVAAATQAPPVETGCTIYLKSPYFGWLAMRLDGVQAQNLVKLLTQPPSYKVPVKS